MIYYVLTARETTVSLIYCNSVYYIELSQSAQCALAFIELSSIQTQASSRLGESAVVLLPIPSRGYFPPPPCGCEGVE